ncbi:SpoIIE family protein phosphatase [Clostridiisalibacter paucivorans]|uniref:SpoIIE family protein phosphatase n=1 Tax=Clostridiisalibacter paucivorans TaxID=408753 RepID=UPI00047D474D|nr:SpoIIE family protein phosphatase [Clostridiisalibacter paucivorans]
MLKDIIISSKNNLKVHKRLAYDILDGMADWVRVIDKNSVVIYANKPMIQELGIEVIGQKCFKCLGKDKPCDRCITETTMSTGVISEKEEIVGDKIYSVKSSPVKDLDGNIYAAVEVFRDVTRERKLESEVLKKNKKMRKDLEFSRRLQKKILPERGNYGSVYIDYMYKPSEALSGDIFDVFNIDERYTGIYISDVMGHGVTASMMTMFIRQSMRAIKDKIIKPEMALKKLHKMFLNLKLDDDQYFTIFYGIIDKKNKQFVYVNGGHNSIPLLIREDNIIPLELRGYPITYLFDNIDYVSKTIDIDKDDKILFYTDGIIEAKNPKGEVFGFERLLKIVKNNFKYDIISSIEEGLSNFNYNMREDDLAIVKARILDLDERR